MSCPDYLDPEPGTPEHLDMQIRALERQKVALLDKEYVESGKLHTDLERLFRRFVRTSYNQPEPKTLAEKVKMAVDAAIKADENYTDSLWKDK